MAKIKEINPNLILIAGGVDYGERDTALDNAEMIRSMGLKTPVIYAGNIENQEEMKLIFDEESGMRLYNVENVYPKIDDLNVEPCRKVIQDAFEDHIIHAPGMEHVRDMVNGPIIPTPGAVMQCTKLLYDCIGDLIVLDVGGATTDLHSVATESDKVARIMVSPEPKAKRTVEGDLGVYVNRAKVIESIGEEKLREECEAMGIDLDKTLESYVAIPKTEDEFKLVERLTKEAVLKAVERHAGKIRYIYGPSGRTTVAEGKDLTTVKYIVGTGGALTKLPHRVEIMQEIAKHNETGMMLFPSEHAEILVDNDYIMASLGVLSVKYREAAIKLLEKSLGIKFTEEVKNTEVKPAYLEEVERIDEAARQKEEEHRKHIKAMEEMGYDMEAYKNPEAIGGATQEEIEEEKRRTLGDEKAGLTKGEGVQGKWTSNAKSCNPTATAIPAGVNEQGLQNMGDCTHECKTCSRIHCKNRNTNY